MEGKVLAPANDVADGQGTRRSKEGGEKTMWRIYNQIGIGYNVSNNSLETDTYMVINGRSELADVRPFRATLYDVQVVGDISRVVAPPYDIIDEEKKSRLLARSPYNVVRLELPVEEGEEEFWKRSASVFRAWKRSGVLVSDEERCLYVHRQSFRQPSGEMITRTGIIAALRCTDFQDGMVMPHERTFPRTRSERLKLLRACRANFSQVFMVFRDRDQEVPPLVEGAFAEPPLLEFGDEEGVEHQLWRLHERETQENLARILAGKRFIIADGHHRYETALTFSREGAKEEDVGWPGRYVSVAMVRAEDPGLVILPVHRLVREVSLHLEETVRKLEGFFDVRLVFEDPAERRGPLGPALEARERAAFFMMTRRGTYLLTLRDGVMPEKEIAIRGSARLRTLDVSVLHHLVLRRCLGLDPDVMAEAGDLCFTPWESEAADAVAGGRAEVAFLLRPAGMDDIWSIAEGGERMPHKSSYFHPKFPSGLIIYDHETAFS